MQIAICDDEQTALDELSSLTEDFILENRVDLIYETFNSYEALCGRLDDFDIFILDYKMSGMDGMSFARLLRQSNPEKTILFVTAYDEIVEATITGYSGDAVYLEMPAALEGVPVTAIAERAFQQNDTIEFIAIPDCIRSVGSYAFSDCLGLKEVYIGEGMQQLGMRTFSGCRSLALVCVMSKTLSWNSTVFIGCDGRMMCVVPSGSAAHASAGATAPHCVRFTYPYEKNDGTRAIAFDGETTLYGDLEYHYWVRLVQEYPDVATLRFERLVFDGVDPDTLGDELSDSYVDRSAGSLTLQNVYVSVEVEGKQITFARLVELLEKGDISLAISFESEENERFSIFHTIGNYMRKVLHALSRLVSAIIRIFKKK